MELSKVPLLSFLFILEMRGQEEADMKILFCDYQIPVPHTYEKELIEKEIPGAVFEEYVYEGDEKELYEKVADADAIMTCFLKIDRVLLEHAQRLKMISEDATGYGDVDVDVAREKGICVATLGDYCTDEVANHAMALILLDLLFVCVFRTGIAGAAWATVISQGISALIVLYVLCRDTGMHQLKPGQIRLEKRAMGEIAKMGIPIGIQSGLIAFSNVVVQTNINYFGVNAVSGCSAFLKIDGILVLPLVSFGLAAMTYTSQNLGAGNTGRIQMGKRATMTICLCYIIPASVFVWIFGAPLIGLFSHDKAVIACGKIMVQVMTPGYWMQCWIHWARQEMETPFGRELCKKWNIPEGYRGVGFCILGYSDERERPAPRRKPGRILYVD